MPEVLLASGPDFPSVSELLPNAPLFHGTVFAVTFQKNFHCIPHPKYRERTDSLLEMLGLMNHNVDKLSSLEDIETNWESVNQILAHERTASINFLETALNSKA